MIKNCKVLINNEAVTVIDFDGTEVQIPAIKKKVNTVRVLKENDKYTVVNDDYKEKTEKIEEIAVVNKTADEKHDYAFTKEKAEKKTTFDAKTETYKKKEESHYEKK